jgi:hypothetical protein
MALTKVFRIELTGGKDVEKDLSAIKRAMSSMATAIAKAKGELAALLVTKGDPGEITKLIAKISSLEGRMKSLSQERKKAEADAKTQAQAEKLLADAKLKTAQADKAAAQAAESRTKSQIAQDKELDRQIDRENRETEALNKKKKALEGLPGSYNAIKNALAALKPFVNSGGLAGTVSFNGQQLNFDQALAEFKRLSAAEQDFRRQFAKDGTLVAEYASGIVDAFKRLNIDDIIKDQVTGAKNQLGELEKKTQQLTVAYREAQKQGSQDMDKLQKEIHDNVVETEALRKKVKEAEVQLGGIGAVGNQITSSISKNFKDLKNSIAQFALTYVGFQALFSGIQSGVDNAKKLSDQTTELEINMGKAKGGAEGLVQSLKGLDTRTNLSGLEEISNIALKAGTTEQNLLGVTKAIDTVKTAFGKDFGDIETGTETFVKLINIFYDDGQVTEDRILKIGNSVRTLANETVASVPFINDFAGRMAGLRQVANVSLPQIIGLGAGFEEFKQSAEVSSTVLVKVIPQLARDIDTFAGIAGTTREEFKKLLQENPIEALLQVSQGLAAGKGDIEVFSNTLKEAGIDAGRAVSIISTLGGKADIFRDRIARAGTAIQSTDAITDAFNRKNENLAATLDKIQKKFADVSGSKTFQATLMAIASLITFVLNNLGILITVIGAYTAMWAVANATLIQTKIATIATNIAFKAQYAWLVISETATKAFALANTFLSGSLIRAAASSTLLATALKVLTGPLGIVLTILGLIGISVVAFGKSVATAVNSLGEMARLQRINNEINREAIKNTSGQIAALDGWIAVIKSASTSADTKRKALEKLVAINPAFRDALKGQAIDLYALDQAYGKVVQAIQAKARAEAAATLSAGKQRKVTDIAGLRQDLEIQIAQDTRGQAVTTVELTDEQIALLEKSNLQATGAILAIIDNRVQILRHRFDDVRKVLNQREKEAIAIYQDYLKAQAQAEDNLTKAEVEVQKTPAVELTESVFQLFDRLVANNGTGADFKDLLKKIQEKKKATDVLSKEYKDLLALEAKVRELLKPKGGASGRDRSPEKQKLDDALKAIEADMTERRNALEKQFADGQISERDYYLGIRDITVKGEQDKINTILDFQERYKKALAKYHGELAKETAEAENKQLAAKREANQKLFDLENKQLEENLRNEQNAALRDRDTALLNPELSNEERLQTTIDYYDRLLVAQVVFNQRQIEQEKKYGIKSKENAEKRKQEIEKIRKELEQGEADRPEARQKDIQDRAESAFTEIRRRVAEQTIEILKSRQSYYNKARALDKLERDATKKHLQIEVDAAKEALDQAEKDRDANLISEKEYQKKLEEYKTKQAALYKLTTDEQISATQRFVKVLKELKDGFLEAVLGIKRYSKDAAGEQERIRDAAKLTADTIRDTVNSAYQSYFKNQEDRIERDKQDQLDTLDREKQRVLARASSEAEKESIERQYAQKQKTIEKKAAEEKKRLAIKQATIDFAVAVMKTFAQFGFPIGLIPVAALTAAYFVQRAQINKQQFARGGTLKKEYGFGGKTGEVPTSGGVFGGRSHSQGGTDFEFGGQSYNAEAGELSIIRTRNAPKTGLYSITGNQVQIASALNNIGGGVSFANGASVKKYAMGGALGSRLKAPYFNAGAYLNGGNVTGKVNDDRIERLEAMTEQVLAAVYSTDAKPVVLVPSNVTKAQRKKVKDTTVGDI